MALQPGLFNITTATDTTLVEQRSQRGSLNFINIANINTEIIKISLYLDDGTNQTYFFKNNFLYPGEILMLDKGISFDDSVLSLKLTTAKPVSVTAVNVNVITK
tara:strand:+ start:1651 stop:1962 length:312 start_codon:yes stop_codon:yes gene_type:complete